MSYRTRTERGFSLVELMVVIGVIMVLLGLALPALSKSRVEAERMRQLKQIQQCATIISAYAGDWKDVYPLAGANQFEASLHWYQAVVAAGMVESARDLDATSYDHGLDLAFALSSSMVSAPKYYVLDAPPYPAWQLRPVTPVRQADVVFPSSKGEVWTWRIGYTKQDNMDVFWCCWEARLSAPVAFSDGSAAPAAWQDLLGADTMRQQEMAGVPVATTWGGVTGRDR